MLVATASALLKLLRHPYLVSSAASSYVCFDRGCSLQIMPGTRSMNQSYDLMSKADQIIHLDLKYPHHRTLPTTHSYRHTSLSSLFSQHGTGNPLFFVAFCEHCAQITQCFLYPAEDVHPTCTTACSFRCQNANCDFTTTGQSVIGLIRCKLGIE